MGYESDFAVNVSDAGMMGFDSAARSLNLCFAADAAVLKGDLELAQRLLVQADMDDPCNPYPEERLVWLDREIKRFETLQFSASPKGRKFDFLYTPTLPGLSTELSSLLQLHPDVFCVPEHELDRAIEGGSESGLLSKYQNQVLNDREHIRAGLVQQACIANQLAGPQVAVRLARVTTRKLFIHGVSDPATLVVSNFNHELIAMHGGGYRFWPVAPTSPFCRIAYVLGDLSKYRHMRTLARRAVDWLQRPRLSNVRLREQFWRKGPVSSVLSPDRGHIDGLLDETLSRPRHFAVGQTYAQHFDAWAPIDLEQSPHPQRQVVKEVFDAIGANPDFDHPAFPVSQGTTIRRLMVQNWIGLDAYGDTLHVGIGYAGSMMFSSTFPLSEMLPFEADARFNALGLGGHTLCVTIRRDQWRMLPRDSRIRLVESGDLLRFRDSVLVPAWLDSCGRWKTAMAGCLKQDLEPDVMARLRERIGADLEKFLRRHPNFESRWPSTNTLVGH